MARKPGCKIFSEPERKVIKYFLSNDNKPSFKGEIAANTGINKALCKKICDEFSDGILKKTYLISQRSGYLYHYFISPNFSTFTCVAKNFIPSIDSSLFFESKHAIDMFTKNGYLKTFKKLGVKKKGHFDFDHDIEAYKRIISDYGHIRKRLFTYLLFYPDSAKNISTFLNVTETSPLRLSIVLEDMRKERILSRNKGEYRVNKEFLRETIKDYPEIYPFFKTKELDELLNLIQEKFGEYLVYKRDEQTK
jgi:hypothetical protein